MGLRIQTNISSLNSQRHLGISSALLAKHTERISSGFRINKAADDAAGLAISEKLRADSRALSQAKRNNQDAISMIQTAEGGLQEISNMLVRLKELSVQAASDTIGNEERGFIQKEFSALKDEIDRTALSTEYNGTRLLTGVTPLPYDLMKESNGSPLEFQIGNNYTPSVDSLYNSNPVNIIRLDLSEMNAMTTGYGSLELGNIQDENEEAGTTERTRVDTKQKAQQSINVVDDAINKVSSYRATLGAIQNRLTHAMSNSGVMIENLEAGRSRIKDADYAEESSNAVQFGILQKAGISVLAQANQIPEMALKLLG